MRIAVRQSYESPVIPRPDVAVFFDVFRASTTLLALLSRRPAHLVSANDLETCRRYRANGYRLVSEVFAGDFDNSPSQVLAASLAGQPVIHKSTNMTNALFHHQGAGRSLIGGFVNASRLARHLRAGGYASVELVACGHFARGTEALEDTTGVALVHDLLAGGDGDVDLSGVHAKLASKRARLGGQVAEHYWEDARLALARDSLPYLAEASRLDATTLEVREVEPQ